MTWASRRGSPSHRTDVSWCSPGSTQGGTALWLIDARTGHELRLAEGKRMDGAFSPDGLQLAAIYQHEVDRCQLLVLELPKRPLAVVSPRLPGVAARA